MTNPLALDCDACFTCAECGRVVCADNELAVCSCSDDPCCNDCCWESHP